MLTLYDIALRVHPVVPGNGRFAIKDTVLPRGGGPDGQQPLFVPKGTMVGYSVFTMHRRKDIYGPDAEEYRPERWETLRPGWEYLPFNGGPRICLGQQYALTEASYVTVRLVQEFSRIESRDPGPWMEGLTLTCASKNGVKVGLTPA
jgi:cytochrome P450